MKKIYLAVCMALCMIALTACGNSKKSSSTTTFNEDTIKSTFETTISSLASQDLSIIEDEKTYDNYVSQSTEELAQSILGLYNTTKDLGAYQSCGDKTVSYADGNAIVESKVKYEKDDVVIRMTFASDDEITSFSSDVYRTFSQKMVKALLNTVMGMGTVFVVLIFISLIIGLLGYVPRLVGGKKQPETTQVESTVVSAPIEEEVVEDEELVEDAELVAVITAAIMASLGDEAPEDGLVVRSIHRVNRKWKNA
ncbi:MAG: OadG family transporter subunit [bacterium]|nr:OadG family transporter subunit [bacterium]